MKTIRTRSSNKMTLACLLVLGIVSGVASAQTNPVDTGYLTEQRGTVIRNGYNQCWHTGTGPAIYTAECDPAKAPAPMAQAAAPTPPPPPVVSPKPTVSRVTLDADTLFDFNKADLRPAGKLALDDFLEQMKGIEPEVIVAVGHADRFGSERYNQILSEKRAASVKTYLLSKGVGTNRVHAEGKGEMQPVTNAGDCNGARSEKVIACLQPDRRVDIEVIGMRITK